MMYDELVNNGIGGTLENPCAGTSTFLVCSFASTAAWAAAADRMFRRVRRRWNEIATAVTVPGPIIAAITALEKDYEGLPLPRVWRPPSTQAAESAALAGWMSSAAAALRLLDGVTGAPAPLQTETQAGPSKTPVWAIVIGVGLVVLVVTVVGVGVWAGSRS